MYKTYIKNIKTVSNKKTLTNSSISGINSQSHRVITVPCIDISNQSDLSQNNKVPALIPKLYSLFAELELLGKVLIESHMK